MLACVYKTLSYTTMVDTIGPFIQGKIRRKLDHLYEHVLSKTKTARINGSRLISVLDSRGFYGNELNLLFKCQFIIRR